MGLFDSSSGGSGSNTNSSTNWGDWIPVAGSALGAIGNIGAGRKNRKAAKEMNERNIQAQQELNQQNRDFSKEMWSLTNAYNSPAQQMARLKEAGLNPHLAYGMQPQASQPMSASTGAPHAEALPADTTINEIGQGAMQASQAYIAMKQQQTQTDNLEKARQVMDAQIVNTNADTANKAMNTARSKFDLDLATDLRNNTLEQAILNTKNLGLTSQKIEMDIRATEKGMQLTDSQISKIAQDILVSQKHIQLMEIQGRQAEAQIATSELDQKLKKLDINLKELGLQPSDSPLFRVPVQLWHKFKNMSMPWDDAPAKKQQYIQRSQR